MPSILIVGSTGNTGISTTETVASQLASSHLSGHRILALTRSANGSAAQTLAKLPGVAVIEKSWTLIDTDWLLKHEVERVFIASHNGATHFTDESLFLHYALEAGVKYVVRISTTVTNVKPLSRTFYGRNHWAIDNLLSQPEFSAMKWTSLKPAVFHDYTRMSLVTWLKAYRSTGKKETLRPERAKAGVPVLAAEPTGSTGHVTVGLEIGYFAGRLLLVDDPAPHTGKGYVLAGPSNITGKQAVDLLSKHAGTSVDDVIYQDVSFITPSETFPANVIPSLKLASVTYWEGATSVEATPTSPEVTALYEIRNGALDDCDKALKQV